jgi:thioredoxin reductase (NADPH)
MRFSLIKHAEHRRRVAPHSTYRLSNIETTGRWPAFERGVITAEMLADLPVFAAFDDAVRAEIADKAADLHLLAGEYLVHEGDEAYFFVVLDGTMQVTKRVGAVEVVLAERRRGDFFGESPVLLGADSFAGLRAVSDCRVLRLDPFDFQALTVLAPEFKAAILEAMMGRLSEIGTRATARKADAVLVVGHRWDQECRRVRTLLARNRVRHEYLVIENPAVMDRLPELAARTDGAYPVVRLIDGTILVQPSIRDLANAVGLQTVPHAAQYDAIVIGGGPGGLAAAVYGASEGLRTLLVEREATGGQAGTSSRIENYLGFPTGLSGDDLGTRALEQAIRLGAEVVVTREVTAMDALAKTVVLDGGTVLAARSIILATGVSWRTLPLEGIERLTGMGVYYGAARSEAQNTRGKDVYLIGGGNSAGQAAMFFSNYANSVTLVVRGKSLANSMSDYLIQQLATKDNIIVETTSEVTAVHGDLHLDAIDVTHRLTASTTRRKTDALFVFIGADAETDWLPPEIARDSRGYVLTGPNVPEWPLERDPFLLESSVPGTFAVGDVRHGSVKRVASAVGEGSMSIAFAHQYLATT